MAKKKPVRMRTVVQRVNQKLSAKGQILIRATRWMKLKVDFGDYYILDLSANVVDTHRPLGVATLATAAPLRPPAAYAEQIYNRKFGNFVRLWIQARWSTA